MILLDKYKVGETVWIIEEDSDTKQKERLNK